MQKKSINEVIEHFGSVSALARAMSVSRTMAQKWRRQGYIGCRHYDYASMVEESTDGAIRAEEVPVNPQT